MQQELLDKLEQKFLAQCIEDKCNVSVYLVNGIKLNGKVLAFGTTVIALTIADSWETQLIYKNNICTVLPIARQP